MPKKSNSSSEFDREREFAVILERVETKVDTIAEGQASQTKEIKLISESQANLIKKINSLQEGQIEIKKKLDMTYETVGRHEVEFNIIKTDIRFMKEDIKALNGKFDAFSESIDNRVTRLESSPATK